MNDNPETIVGSCTVEGIAGLIDNINRCKGEYNKCDIYPSFERLILLIINNDYTCRAYANRGLIENRQMCYYQYQAAKWLSDLDRICRECAEMLSSTFNKYLASSILKTTKYEAFTDLIIDSEFVFQEIMDHDYELAMILARLIPAFEEDNPELQTTNYDICNYSNMEHTIITNYNFYDYLCYKTCGEKYQITYPRFRNMSIGIRDDNTEVNLNNPLGYSPIPSVFLAYIQHCYLNFINRICHDIISCDFGEYTTNTRSITNRIANQFKELLPSWNDITITIPDELNINIVFALDASHPGVIRIKLQNHVNRR